MFIYGGYDHEEMSERLSVIDLRKIIWFII